MVADTKPLIRSFSFVFVSGSALLAVRSAFVTLMLKYLRWMFQIYNWGYRPTDAMQCDCCWFDFVWTHSIVSLTNNFHSAEVPFFSRTDWMTRQQPFNFFAIKVGFFFRNLTRSIELWPQIDPDSLINFSSSTFS